MGSLTLSDLSSRATPMGRKKWTKKADFKPGGEKGKLHRELGVPEGEKIPEKRLHAAAHSKDREVRNDAIRAETMKKWKPGAAPKGSPLYTHRSSNGG